MSFALGVVLLNHTPERFYQCFKARVTCDTHDVIDAIAIAPVEQKLPTKTAITAEDDLNGWPMRSDEVNQQFKDRCRVFRAVNLTLSKVSDQGESPAKAIQRQIAVVVVTAMEELLRLVTMQRYIRRIEVQNDLWRWFCVTAYKGIQSTLCASIIAWRSASASNLYRVDVLASRVIRLTAACIPKSSRKCE